MASGFRALGFQGSFAFGRRASTSWGFGFLEEVLRSRASFSGVMPQALRTRYLWRNHKVKLKVSQSATWLRI